MQKKNIKIQYIIILFLITLVFLSIPNKVQAAEDVTNRFKDENLKNAILKIIRKVEGNNEKQNILLSDIDKITADTLPSGKQLNLAGKNIRLLDGLELFENKGIEWIYLDWNEIEDITVLSKFKDLTKISASGNEITDISAIASLKDLQNINFSNNHIKEITPILGLGNIKYLYLDNNQIQDIAGISNLNKLKEISISGNSITNIDELTKITTLENIDVSRNKIEDISNIKQNITVTKMNLNYNNITRLEGIEKLKNLQVLSASNNQIKDISSIETLTKINNLNLNKNNITNIAALANCTQLEYLYLDSNNIINIIPIENIDNLKKISIYNQTYKLIIEKDYQDNDIKLKLTSLFTNIKDQQSKIYVKDANFTGYDNIEDFVIANDWSYLVVSFQKLKEQNIVLKISDENYTYMTLELEAKVYEEDMLTNNEYNIEDEYIKNVDTNLDVATFMKKTNLKNRVAYISRKNEILDNTQIIKNGDILKVQDKSYTIIVKGDPSGDGTTNIIDLMKITKYIMNKGNLKPIEYMAADLNGDNSINIIDLMKITKIINNN